MLNKLGQALFGLNDRRNMKSFVRKDTIVVMYRGQYIAMRLDWPQNSAKDKKFLNHAIERLDFRKEKGV